MKKFVATLALLPLAVGLAACGSNSASTTTTTTTAAAEGTAENPIKIGIVGESNEHEAFVKAAAEEGLTVEIVDLGDYNQPNPALASGDIDVNWFQHIDYLSTYNVENNDTLQILGPTVVYPMALFSSKHSSIDAIPEGAEIAVPNDPSNLGRALLLLEANGLVKFTSDTTRPTIDDLDTAASKVKVTPVDAAQTVLSMESVDGSVVNNDFIMDAGLNPSDALAQDDASSVGAKPYVNLFVTTDEKKDDETFKKLVDIFNTKPVLDAVAEVSEGTAVQVDLSTEELRGIQAELEEAKRNAQ